MEKYGALFAVFSNIENEDYIKIILNDVLDLVRDMQDVTEGEIQEARKLIGMIGDEIDDISDMDIEKWLKNFKTEALLTP